MKADRCGPTREAEASSQHKAETVALGVFRLVAASDRGGSETGLEGAQQRGLQQAVVQQGVVRPGLAQQEPAQQGLVLPAVAQQGVVQPGVVRPIGRVVQQRVGCPEDATYILLSRVASDLDADFPGYSSQSMTLDSSPAHLHAPHSKKVRSWGVSLTAVTETSSAIIRIVTKSTVLAIHTVRIVTIMDEGQSGGTMAKSMPYAAGVQFDGRLLIVPTPQGQERAALCHHTAANVNGNKHAAMRSSRLFFIREAKAVPISTVIIIAEAQSKSAAAATKGTSNGLFRLYAGVLLPAEPPLDLTHHSQTGPSSAAAAAAAAASDDEQV
ncbi:MAG: hypothetical protein FRX49_06916 [Trebouxia sp. A1-2]|nr:MAG: hypothetical protein FRX49_06916 [Trebouxia sp. A1-2]